MGSRGFAGVEHAVIVAVNINRTTNGGQFTRILDAVSISVLVSNTVNGSSRDGIGRQVLPVGGHILVFICLRLMTRQDPANSSLTIRATKN